MRTRAGLPLERPGPGWLGSSRLGFALMALVVGALAGLGAAVFRWLVFTFTWVATGHQEFGQQGHIGSPHFPGLGIWFVLIVPVLGGLLYGPLIQRFAREARGHGVPEVILAVAENGGRIRPPVTVVKALASAICIGTGGSVGREGPIVQVGSAIASTVGQWVRMPEVRLRMIVACGAAGGIAATFNAPITGLFFGFEIILREFSLDALFATSLAAVTGDVISRAFFGSAPFFTGMPHHLLVTTDLSYLLIGVLAAIAALGGVAFKTFLYRFEEFGDAAWRGRAEWARPAVGGLALGVVVLVLPGMYGVGYPVMDKVVGGHAVLWLILVLLLGKIFATSLTLSIGGSGGVFAPSLFIGAMIGMAFGIVVHHLFGPSIGPPGMYAVVAMGGVFAAAAQAPLTSIASVLEMTGNFTLSVPVMLACGLAAAISKRLSYGSIYTTKLLRRGIDIERPSAATALRSICVSDVMYPLAFDLSAHPAAKPSPALSREGGSITDVRQPQALFVDENLEQALRQLVLYGHHGLPVLSADGRNLRGWVTRSAVLRALARGAIKSPARIEHGALAAEFATDDPQTETHTPPTPLHGYEIVELTLPAETESLDDIAVPPGAVVVAIRHGGEVQAPANVSPYLGDRAIILAPTPASRDPRAEPAALSATG